METMTMTKLDAETTGPDPNDWQVTIGPEGLVCVDPRCRHATGAAPIHALPGVVTSEDVRKAVAAHVRNQGAVVPPTDLSAVAHRATQVAYSLALQGERARVEEILARLDGDALSALTSATALMLTLCGRRGGRAEQPSSETADLREYWTVGPGSEPLVTPGWLKRAARWMRRRRP
jgi:hypothetical protein